MGKSSREIGISNTLTEHYPKLGERAQHIEEGRGRYVLDARDHLDVIRRKRKMTAPEGLFENRLILFAD